MLNFNFLQFIHNLHSLTLYTYVNTFNSKDSYNLGHILFWERDNYLISRNVFVPLHRESVKRLKSKGKRLKTKG